MRRLTIIKILSLFLVLLNFNCRAQKTKFTIKEKVYESENLQIFRVAEHSYIHISYLQTNDWGKVACNGLLINEGSEAIIFDTPTQNQASKDLINWVENNLKSKITAVVPTHFHSDCLGGLSEFELAKITSYANNVTIELAEENNFAVPQIGFSDSLILNIGKEKVQIKFYGQGHTIDNVVAYFAEDNIMFGGCLIKELQASIGYLGDANVAEWSNTVSRIKNDFPNLKMVIPGHGKEGGTELFDYTIQLFKQF